MIKSVSFKNILSFKDETIIDFEVYKNSGPKVAYREFQKKSVSTAYQISNFALIYGKNNSGKSNLLTAINSIFYYILNNFDKDHPTFDRFATTKDKPIEVEIELISSEHLYRYGFVIEKNSEISSEWMYINKNMSKNETMIFERYTERDKLVFNLSSILNRFKPMLETLKPQKTIISALIGFKINELSSFFKIIKSVVRIVDIEEDVNRNLPVNKLDIFCSSTESMNLLNDFVKQFDTNIKELKISKVDSAKLEQMEEVSKYIRTLKQSEKGLIDSKVLVEKFGDEVISDLLQYNYVIGFESLDKKEKKGYSFSANFFDTELGDYYDIDYNNLSFGTRKLIVFMLNILSSDEGTIFLVDEIEHGFHKVLLNALMELLVKTAEIKNYQFIFTTHEEGLLDIDEISNETKIILENTNSTKIKYISDYQLRAGTKLSSRYIFGAFKGIPRIDIGEYNEKIQ